jgi:hypothetical protein
MKEALVMNPPRRVLSYANVAATLALFLALSGGVVYAAGGLGKNAVKSKNIAPNAVKAKNIAANAVTGGKIKKEAITPGKIKKASLTRLNLAAGTLAGLQIADAQSTAVPGLATSTETGTPVPLTGTASFTPVAGKSYELLTEMKGTPSDADGAGGESCYTEVAILDNGAPIAYASIFANASAPAPFTVQPLGGSTVPIGQLSAGQAQTLTALSSGSTGCGGTTTAALRLVVVELG